MPEFAGRLIFLENYNMHIASYLVSGVDIWLNTPTRPLEASGTSGEKAVMNGVVNFSVLDGWYAEGYRENAGWAIQEARTYGNQQFQDELDAETIYDMLEDEIIPSYFDKSDDGISHKWVSYVKNTISEIAPNYTMKRMLDDYIDKFYNKLVDRSRKMQQNNYSFARKIERWKRRIVKGWNDMEIVSAKYPGNDADNVFMGEKADIELKLRPNGLNAEDIGVELLVGKKENDNEEKVKYIIELELNGVEDDIAIYRGKAPIEVSGMVRFIYRVYPKSDMLPHRQDFNLVKWV
jgi:glucan phosphorylase